MEEGRKSLNPFKIVVASLLGTIPVVALVFVLIFHENEKDEKEKYDPQLASNILEVFKKETFGESDGEIDKIVSFSYTPGNGMLHISGINENYLFRSNLTIEKNLNNKQLVKYFLNKEYETKKYQMTASERHDLLPCTVDFLYQYKTNYEGDDNKYYAGTVKDSDYVYSINMPLEDDELNIESISKKDVFKVSINDKSMLPDYLATLINNKKSD